MIKIITNTIQLGIIVVWGITCYYICRSEDGFQYFIYWIIMGFPFGFQKLRMLLIQKGFGIAGEIGVFALDAIVAGLIGGIFLVKKIVVIMADYIKAIGKIIRPT
ncbi:MAG: DUF6050 family protein [Bacilli bacterium]|nr:DUF6050 family protein [Bacilli bacterium]